MLLALCSFGWMWWRTHQLAEASAARAARPVQARPITLDVEPQVVGADR